MISNCKVTAGRHPHYEFLVFLHSIMHVKENAHKSLRILKDKTVHASSSSDLLLLLHLLHFVCV